MCSEYGQQFLLSWNAKWFVKDPAIQLLCIFLTLKHYEKADNVLAIDSLKSNFFNILLYSVKHESGISFNDMQIVSDHSYLAFLMNRKLYQ